MYKGERVNYNNLPPGPEVKYHPFFTLNPDPLFDVRINPSFCGALLRSLGLPDNAIRSSMIVVTPETPDSLSGRVTRAARFDSWGNVVFYLPGIVWNNQQSLSATAASLRTGSSKFSLVRCMGFEVGVFRFEECLDNNGSGRGGIEDKMREELRHLLGTTGGEQFFEYLYMKEDPATAMTMLREGSRKALIESLAYGLHKLAYHRGRHNLAGTVIKVFYPEEFMARRFARQVSNDPYWNDLVVPEKGWD